MKTAFRAFALPFALLFALTLGTPSALAAYNFSSYSSYTVYYQSYQNQAELDWGPIGYRTYVTATSASYGLPAGWMGTEGRLLYQGNGALCQTTGMQYNSSQIVGQSSGQYGSCGYNTYYSQGKTAAWNGNAYSYYYTYRTIAQAG